MNPSANSSGLFAWSVFFVGSLCPFMGRVAIGEEKIQEKQYEYREDLKTCVGVIRGKQFLLGRLDSQGNFMPDPFATPFRVGQPFSGPHYELINKQTRLNQSVYEFRSGMLIKGKLDRDGNFIPEVGSTVISFKDYRFSKDAIRIYNLPGTFVEKTDKKPKP
jgi:hypothetical protein